MAEKSEQDVRQQVEELLQEIERQRETAQQQGLRFAARSEEELYRKVRGEESSSSPFIFAQAGGFGGPPGTNDVVAWYVSNPDATEYYPLFMSLFFGAANFLDDIGEGLSGRDQRWPYCIRALLALLQESYGASSSLTAYLTFPTALQLVLGTECFGEATLLIKDAIMTGASSMSM